MSGTVKIADSSILTEVEEEILEQMRQERKEEQEKLQQARE